MGTKSPSGARTGLRSGTPTLTATSRASPRDTTSAPEVAGIEAAFGDANIAGVTGPAAATATAIATNGVTTLDELEVNGSSQNGDVYELNPAGGTGGPLLELNGGVVTKGQFPAG